MNLKGIIDEEDFLGIINFIGGYKLMRIDCTLNYSECLQ